MRRRVLLAAMVAVVPLSALAQKKEKVRRVGLLWIGAGEAANLKDALLAGLREHGYVVNRNLELLDRTQVSRYEQLQQAAKDLVQAQVEVIVCYGAAAPHAAHEATATIPIVIVGTDPVEGGLAKSLARPGGNVTGIANLVSALLGKRLEILKECVPNARQIAALLNPASDTAVKIMLPTLEAEARRLKLRLYVVEARNPEEFEEAFARAAKTNSTALFIVPSTLFTANRRALASLALKYRMASMGTTLAFVDAGVLLAYGPNYEWLFRRAAGYVVRVFKGENPAEMPIEQPSEFELAINMKTAKALGLRIPETLRFRATRLVE